MTAVRSCGVRENQPRRGCLCCFCENLSCSHSVSMVLFFLEEVWKNLTGYVKVLLSSTSWFSPVSSRGRKPAERVKIPTSSVAWVAIVGHQEKTRTHTFTHKKPLSNWLLGCNGMDTSSLHSHHSQLQARVVFVMLMLPAPYRSLLLKTPESKGTLSCSASQNWRFGWCQKVKVWQPAPPFLRPASNLSPATVCRLQRASSAPGWPLRGD